MTTRQGFKVLAGQENNGVSWIESRQSGMTPIKTKRKVLRDWAMPKDAKDI